MFFSLSRVALTDSLKKKDFPLRADIFRSGSDVFRKFKLKVRNPENPDRTINRISVPKRTPPAAMEVIMLMVLLLLFEKRYLLAM